MLDTRITLSGLWVAVMLTYLWGDVLRIFAGHVTPGEILGVGGHDIVNKFRGSITLNWVATS